MDVFQGSFYLIHEVSRARLGAALFARDVEEHQVVAGDDVGDAVAVVGHGAEAAARADALRVFLQVQLASLTMRGLAGGQPPGLVEHLLQEGRLQFQVLGDHVQAEQVAVDAAPGHRVLVAQLVPLCGFAKQLELFFNGGVRVLHGRDPGGTLDGAGAHGLRAALAEQARHGGLVGEAEAARAAVIRQLQDQLDERVRRHAALLHEPFAILVVHEYLEVDVVEQFLRDAVRAVDGLG